MYICLMDDLIAMNRCISIAKNSGGWNHPNPKVGSIVVHNNRIIGEGFHYKYGSDHAEVMALKSIRKEDEDCIKDSILYVNLEPCSHFGKTPPCADLIITKGIKKVIIGSSDPNPKVSGAGIRKLKLAGVKVIVGINEIECQELNKRFFKSIIHGLPYIVLKWAESSDKFIDGKRNSKNFKPYKISSSSAQPIVHSWRSQEEAILVGIKTFVRDEPQLNVRYSSGPNPKKILWIPNHRKTDEKIIEMASKDNWVIWTTNFGESSEESFIQHLKNCQFRSILVEGGANTINHFFKTSIWDECRIIRNKIILSNGVKAPFLPKNAILKKAYSIDNDEVFTYLRK